MRWVHSSSGVVESGVAPAESVPAADLPPERVSEAKRLRMDEGVAQPLVVAVELDGLSGVATVRLGVQDALRVKGGVRGSEELVDEEVEESVEGGIAGC